MSEDFQKLIVGDVVATEEVRIALSDVVRAKAIYWDACNKLESMLVGEHGYVDKVDSRISDLIDNLSAATDDPDSAAQVVSTEDAEACIKYVEDFQ